MDDSIGDTFVSLVLSQYGQLIQWVGRIIEVRGGGIRTHLAEMQERVGVTDRLLKWHLQPRPKAIKISLVEMCLPFQS